MHPSFRRHIDAAHNTTLPGDRLAFSVGGIQVGWLKPDFARALAEQGSITRTEYGLNLPQASALPELAGLMAEKGHYRFRDEAFDVRHAAGTPSLSTIDRGALPSFGILAEGVHLNGLVHRTNGLHLWVARRSATKPLDPGKLDHLTAGGISAGMTAFETLIKEAAEEAAIPPHVAACAHKKGEIAYTMEREEGLRRDALHCYDLVLPEDFTPRAADGEVESFELWPIRQAFEVVRDTDDFKFNVNLVLIDLFTRLGMMSGSCT